MQFESSAFKFDSAALGRCKTGRSRLVLHLAPQKLRVRSLSIARLQSWKGPSVGMQDVILPSRLVSMPRSLLGRRQEQISPSACLASERYFQIAVILFRICCLIKKIVLVIIIIKRYKLMKYIMFHKHIIVNKSMNTNHSSN